VVYVVHTRAHYDDLDRLLASAARHLSEEYAAASTPGERAQIVARDVSAGVGVRLYGPEGRMLDGSPDAAAAPEVNPRAVLAGSSEPPFDPVAGLAPPFIEVRTAGGEFGVVDASGNGRWRVFVLPVEGSGYLVATASLETLDSSIERLRWLVGLLSVAAAAVAVAASALLAGRALRPLARLNRTADNIARSTDFSQRVPAGPREDELGQLSSTFNGMLDSLEDAYQVQKQFVADASHELRAPLTAIQGNLELIRRHPDQPVAEQHEAVIEADREAQRLSRLVADLLSLARADAGLVLRRQRVELDRVVLEALATARHMGRGQGVELAALEPALVEGDADRLGELLLIILDNALKYTPPEGQIIVNLCRHGRNAEVTVRDTGVGIPEEDVEHVFERFYRADPARGRDPAGTGLGLPIARWIAVQHGGEIELQSQPDKGTTVTVRLPLATT
jgi:signal transduction histidine kinase